MDVRKLIVVKKQLFSKEECEYIIDKKDSYDMKPGGTYSNYNVNEQMSENRICQIGWIDPRSFPYIDRIKDFINGYNTLERFALADKIELQFTEYKKGSWFKRHQDFYMNISSRTAFSTIRKISMTIQLSDSEDYVGGDVIITTDINDKGSKGFPISRNIGDAIAFPSYFDHQVNKIESGTRYSLVVWQYGPHWK